MKGRGSPVGGMEAVTTAILITACIAIMEIIPADRKLPNKSGAVSATLIPLHIRIRKRRIRKVAPMKPSSSPIMAKIKSVSG